MSKLFGSIFFFIKMIYSEDDKCEINRIFYKNNKNYIHFCEENVYTNNALIITIKHTI